MTYFEKSLVAIILVLISYNLIQIPEYKLTLTWILSKIPGLQRLNKVAITTTTSLAVLSILFIASRKYIGQAKIIEFFHKLGSMNLGYSEMKFNNSRFSSRGSREANFALKNGGEVGGISNDGNTCFMNSVIQSLASSHEFLKFIDSCLNSDIEIDTGDRKETKVKSNTVHPELVFTASLKSLIDNVNGSYGTRGKEFSTKYLLNKMPRGPKQNFFSRYNQEDAQEFYQLVMSLVESEYKKVNQNSTSEGKKDADKFFEISSVEEDIALGYKDLSRLGHIYVPALQVDPNLQDCESKVYQLDLITPVDGISVERIGCLSCGEVGGIRYAVNSGLSLNLPYTSSMGSGFSLNGLLDEWISPEIIEDVNCNRCGLMQTKEFLLQQVDVSNNEKISEQFKERIKAIDNELGKNHITDEVFEKLSIKQMIRKTKKSKQILLSRPPPLLSIHINRSVFDPNTYRIAKNSSNVGFPAKLDLRPYVAEPDDVNMDARFPFRKQDEDKIGQTQLGVEQKSISSSMSSLSSSSSKDSGIEEENDVADDAQDETTQTSNKKVNDDEVSNLVYNLKAVIVHYGTHNYGHYICYRKHRGTWWRISDESVAVVTENEVLSGQGTFMLFYEFDDGYRETLEPLDEKDSSSSSFETQSSAKSESSTESYEYSSESKKSSSSDSIHKNEEGDMSIELAEAAENNSDEGAYTNSSDPNEFNLGEERAHL